MSCTLLKPNDPMFDPNQDLYSCDSCGHVWDGNALCLCGLHDMSSDSELEDSYGEINFVSLADRSTVTLRQLFENGAEIAKPYKNIDEVKLDKKKIGHLNKKRDFFEFTLEIEEVSTLYWMNWNTYTSQDMWYDTEMNHSDINIYGHENNKLYENLLDIWIYMYSIKWVPGFIPGYPLKAYECKFETLEEALRNIDKSSRVTGITVCWDYRQKKYKYSIRSGVSLVYDLPEKKSSAVSCFL